MLMSGSTLIIAECSVTARELCKALTPSGAPLRVTAPQSVMADWWPREAFPDVILVDAALDRSTVAALQSRLLDDMERPPAVICFAHADCQRLATRVAEGCEYLVPPFLPHLVQSRLVSSRRERDLRLTVGEVRVASQRREYERELQIGREIQRGFLPETLPVVEGWEIAAYFSPAREVSGDFYDAYDVIDGSFLGFAIADVCDKGVGAALFMALIRSLLRQAVGADDGTVEHGGRAHPSAGADLALRAVSTTNDYLTANHLHQAYFATLFFGLVDPRTGDLMYINCGHNAPVVRRATGEQVELPPTGPALGLVQDASFGLGQDVLRDGDALFLYTDGVPEAKDAHGEFFGDHRIRFMLTASGTAAEIVDRFTRGVVDHVGAAEQFDDVTMLGLRRTPRPLATASDPDGP